MKYRQEAGKLVVAFVLAVLGVQQGDAPFQGRMNLWTRWDRKKGNGMCNTWRGVSVS